MSNIKLTQTVQKGGCAAKVAASELRKILSTVEFPKAPDELLVDGGHFDDAAIYKISEDCALVQTMDFFTPILDTPYQFGRVAACNSLSDVYAMGGVPKTAMAILAVPLATMPYEVITEVMQGACDLLSEAATPLVGGHSIDDETLKFGLSVTGFVHPQKVWSNQGARVGDKLILTKPLGTGTATAALKRGEVTEEQIHDVVQSMGTLNNIHHLLNENELSHIHAATDITGFGLSGHSMQMAKASQKTIRIDSAKLPLFMNTISYLEKGFLTKAHRTNKEYVANHANIRLEGVRALVLHDPQTSGGLLLSVHDSYAQKILERVKNVFSKAEIIGEVTAIDKTLAKENYLVVD